LISYGTVLRDKHGALCWFNRAHRDFATYIAAVAANGGTAVVFFGVTDRGDAYFDMSGNIYAHVAKRIDKMAKQRRLSENRILVDLMEQGIEVRRQKEKAFFELAERFRAGREPEQVKELGNQLGASRLVSNASD
jgi:hypothetical protein